MSKWHAIPRPGEDEYRWRQHLAGMARGERRSINAFIRRIAIKGLLREIEEWKGEKVRLYSLTTIDTLVKMLRKTALQYGSEYWVRKALTVKRNTLINDLKAIRKERKDEK